MSSSLFLLNVTHGSLLLHKLIRKKVNVLDAIANTNTHNHLIKYYSGTYSTTRQDELMSYYIQYVRYFFSLSFLHFFLPVRA